MTQQQREELITQTLNWADDLSERWTGTLHEKIIFAQKSRLVNATDYESQDKLLQDLVLTLENSEREFED
jgi:hypothetical protein